MSFERGPYLALAAFCENVIESKKGPISLINVVDRSMVTIVGHDAPAEMPPQTITWTLVLSFKSGEARGAEDVRIEIERPSGLRGDPLSLSAHFEGGNRGVNIIAPISLTVAEPGLYWFWVYVGDELITKMPLEVIYQRVSAQPPPQAPR